MLGALEVMTIIIILFIVAIVWLLFSVFCALVNVTPEEKRQEDEDQIEFLKKLREKNKEKH